MPSITNHVVVHQPNNECVIGREIGEVAGGGVGNAAVTGSTIARQGDTISPEARVRENARRIVDVVIRNQPPNFDVQQTTQRVRNLIESAMANEAEAGRTAPSTDELTARVRIELEHKVRDGRQNATRCVRNSVLLMGGSAMMHGVTFGSVYGVFDGWYRLFPHDGALSGGMDANWHVRARAASEIGVGLFGAGGSLASNVVGYKFGRDLLRARTAHMHSATVCSKLLDRLAPSR